MLNLNYIKSSRLQEFFTENIYNIIFINLSIFLLVLGHVDTQWVVASRAAGEDFFIVWTVLGSHAKEIAAVSV